MPEEAIRIVPDILPSEANRLQNRIQRLERMDEAIRSNLLHYNRNGFDDVNFQQAADILARFQEKLVIVEQGINSAAKYLSKLEKVTVDYLRHGFKE